MLCFNENIVDQIIPQGNLIQGGQSIQLNGPEHSELVQKKCSAECNFRDETPDQTEINDLCSVFRGPSFHISFHVLEIPERDASLAEPLRDSRTSASGAIPENSSDTRGKINSKSLR